MPASECVSESCAMNTFTLFEMIFEELKKRPGLD